MPDERGLSERRLPRHAGQQHETQRNDAVEADVIAERHPELRREERHARQHNRRYGERGRETQDARANHSSSSW
jgi:hypothetical protein